MGIFDFLRGKGKSAPPPAASAPVDKKVAGPAKVVADKRAQTYDRIEAIQALADMKTPEAAAALLKRFTFSIDPSITDQDEKDLAFQGIVAAGRGETDRLPEGDAARDKLADAVQVKRDQVIDAARAFCAKAEQLTWPLKVMRSLLDDEEYVAELVDLLEKHDTEYARNVEPKVQLIIALGEVVNDEARAAVLPFLDDVNETVRFHAVQTSFAQGDPACLPAMAKLLEGEESVRIKNEVAKGALARGWAFPADLRESVQSSLRDTEDYALDSAGKVVKS